MNKIFEQLLKARSITDDFLYPKYERLSDPYLLPDMKVAIDRIKEAINREERVLIYGDYDVDGVTASTVMADALTMAGIKNVEIMLPDRFKDGYGMSKKIIDFAKERKIGLVVTVDCGSNNHEIINELSVNKIDVIVTDHHECPVDLPKALAVINPKRVDYDGFRDIAGVGVAFKVALALMKEGLIPDGQEKWLLDLVVLGTICDNMPIISENRIFGYYGMKVLAKTKRVGLVELMKRAKIKKIDSVSIGFQIGPRLNAAGRIKSAELALRLIRTKSRPEAAKLADELELLNVTRKNEQSRAVSEIARRGVGDNNVIVESGKWHEGVLGIIAGRLVEEYKKPAFVLSEVEEGVLKGSGRSFGEFNLAAALDFCKKDIVSGGGHAGACGIKIESDKLDDFTKSVNEYYKSLKLVDQERFLSQRVDLEVDSLKDFTIDLVDELKMLEPFGEGNNEPVFQLENANIIDSRRLGADGKHLCLIVEGKDRNSLKMVGFSAPESWFSYSINDQCNIKFRVVENEWNGIRNIEGQIIDIF